MAFVTIDAAETDNWGIAGETVTARRKRGRAKDLKV